MNKIIVIERCEDCPYCGQIGGTRYCVKGFQYIDDPALSVVELYEHKTEMPGWCPLPDLPEEATPENSDMGINWNLGWNAALAVIKTITGGEEK